MTDVENYVGAAEQLLSEFIAHHGQPNALIESLF